MTRGLHPQTRPQRMCGDDGKWASASDDVEVEHDDVPPRQVAKALGWTMAGLLVSMGLVALLMTQMDHRRPIGAKVAEERFHSAGPPLLSKPEAELTAEEAAHPAPAGQELARAARTVEERGWGENAPAPSRAETAMRRAEEVR